MEPNDSQGKITQDSNNWPVTFKQLKNPPAWLSSAACIAIFLFVFFLISISIIAIFRLTSDLISGDQQRGADAVKSLLPIAAAAVGLPLIIWRLVILNRQTETAEAKTQIDREIHYTSIFSRSIDQLGQTREVKETKETPTGWEQISRTVPNIEVRLGGIHSISRLAEESVRDQEKIENTLLSYVRENSWSDREGSVAAGPKKPELSKFDWSYEYRTGSVDDTVKAAFEEWREATRKTKTAHYQWGRQQKETRVDVNEAVEAIPKINRLNEPETRSRFYECLFVGRVFAASQLKFFTFERCIFIRCRLEANSQIATFLRCQFYSCNITATTAKLNFSFCDFWSGTISSQDAKLNLQTCEATDLIFSRSKKLEATFTRTTFLNGWLSKIEALNIIAKNCYFVEFSFGQNRFLSGSSLEDSVFVDARLNDTDLSSVSDLDSDQIKYAKGSINTKLPSGVEMPESWSQPDEDEIPF